MKKFGENATYKETLGPAMKITDQAEADEYFEALVSHAIMSFGRDRAKAESNTRSNLGYYAGYYDDETRERVERLFSCKHPVFGAIKGCGSPTPKEAFEAGMKLGEESRAKKPPDG